MRTIPVAIVIGSVALLAGCAAQNPSAVDGDQTSSAMMEASSEAMMPASSAPAMNASEAMGEPEASARVIEVVVDDWSFTPASVTVKKGEKVTLKLVSKDGVHGLAIPGMSINERIENGATVSVALNTDTVGTFDGFCSVPCGAGHSDMKFAVIVTA